MNPLARHLWPAAAIVAAAFAATGCDKAKEESVPAQATVIMPGTPAPTDTPASTPQPAVASSTMPPLATGDATAGISVGNSGPPTGGTVSVIPGPAPTPTTTTTTTGAAPGTAPANPPDVSVLPPAGSASLPGAGSIGPAASDASDNQPPSKAPGSRP